MKTVVCTHYCTVKYKDKGMQMGAFCLKCNALYIALNIAVQSRHCVSKLGGLQILVQSTYSTVEQKYKDGKIILVNMQSNAVCTWQVKIKR